MLFQYLFKQCFFPNSVYAIGFSLVSKRVLRGAQGGTWRDQAGLNAEVVPRFKNRVYTTKPENRPSKNIVNTILPEISHCQSSNFES